MTSFETLSVERRGDGTALLTIRRSEKLNAMNRAFFSELPRLFQALDDDPNVKVAVITGEGRAFSAGGDIQDFDALDGSVDAARRQVRAALDAFNAVERAETEELYKNPLHPYTKALFSAALPSHPDINHEEIILSGEVPSPINPPAGCHFHPRCPFAMEQCSQVSPELKAVAPGHLVSCHLY